MDDVIFAGYASSQEGSKTHVTILLLVINRTDLMASIDKQTIRAEFYKIKAGFDEQVKSGKVSTEIATLVNTLMILFNIVLSIFMEKNTKKTSANSSIPPSQTTPDDSSTTNKNKGAKNGMDAIEIIPHYGGVIVHDYWASYLSYDHLKHGLCGSHLLRELTFIVDSTNYRWAKKMKHLLQRACKIEGLIL